MYQYRVNQRRLQNTGNDTDSSKSVLVFVPVEEIIQHCDTVSHKFAIEINHAAVEGETLPHAA